jgi:hypothetical protein
MTLLLLPCRGDSVLGRGAGRRRGPFIDVEEAFIDVEERDIITGDRDTA